MIYTFRINEMYENYRNIFKHTLKLLIAVDRGKSQYELLWCLVCLRSMGFRVLFNSESMRNFLKLITTHYVDF